MIFIYQFCKDLGTYKHIQTKNISNAPLIIKGTDNPSVARINYLMFLR